MIGGFSYNLVWALIYKKKIKIDKKLKIIDKIHCLTKKARINAGFFKDILIIT
jgi:hypothetical protein